MEEKIYIRSKNQCNLFCRNGHYQFANTKAQNGTCSICLPEKNRVRYRETAEYKKAYQREYRIKNLERIKVKDRFKSLRVRYGVTQQVYDAMFKQQNGVCKICKQTEMGKYKNLSVDHDHKTGNVRGLLCRRCNLGLVYLDNQNFMNGAKKYLEVD